MNDILDRLLAARVDYDPDVSSLDDLRAVLSDARMVIAEALGLLRYMIEVEDHPCRLDHHGYCQDHPGGFRTLVWPADDPECWIAATRALIARAES